MSSGDFIYQGSELELFANAVNWKNYWSAQVRKHLGQDVLEVGAGNGVNTPYLNKGAREWVCLEPDSSMAHKLDQRQRANQLPATRVVAGTIVDLPATPSFDSIIYIDVLEHIEDDAAEVMEAVRRLRPGGNLIVLGPAHNWLFSPFDRAVGHFRRYSAADLRALTRPELKLISLRELDFVGILASLANRSVLKQDIPTVSQILLWDRFIVPISRLLDPLVRYSFGKTIMAVWQRR